MVARRTPVRAILPCLVALAVLTSIQQLCVLASDTSDCSVNELAQNSSVVLTWTLLTGDESFTRISHTSEALVGSSSSSVTTDRLVIVGGIEYESAQPVVVNPLLIYDLKTNVFFKPKDAILSSLSAQPASSSKQIVDDSFTSPASRSNHASFISNSNVVYLFGGQNKEFLNDTWRLCVDASSATASWDQLVAPSDPLTVQATPVPRVGHSFTQVFENSSMIGAIVFGGISDSYVELDGLHMAFIAKSSPAGGRCTDRSPKMTWRMLPATAAFPTTGVPSARAYHSAMVVSKLFSSTKIVCLLVYGGKNTQQGLIFSELWRLCPPVTNSSSTATVIVEKQVHIWELLVPLGTTPGARYGAAVTFVDEGKLALSGGSYTFPNDFLRDTWELNVNATQWVRLSFDDDYTPTRRGHSLTFFPSSSKLFLFGGKDRYAVIQKRIESTLYAAPYCATGYRITLCEATDKYVCIPCPAGLFLQSGTRNCLPCAQGTFSSLGSAECTKCPAGTFSTIVGKTSDAPCMQCPAGTASSALGASSLTSCLACAAGTFASSPGSTACSTCLPGSYSNASAGTCTLCKPGQWSATGAPTCQSCAAGSYNPNDGSLSCFACPKGFYSNSGADACLPCPLNTFSNVISTPTSTGCQSCLPFSFTTATGQTRCAFCPPGSSFVNSTCQACPSGSFSSAGTSGACQFCPVGYYAPGSGATQCTKCPDGSITLAAGAKTLVECIFCQAGYYLDGSQCRSCAPGTFASSTGFCSQCAPGSYTSSILDASRASGDCLKCPAMTYTSDLGSTRCTACVDGAFSLTGWKNYIACGLTEQQLIGCKVGRNGLMCSGNGQCIYGGCACNDGWTSADCGAPASEATTSSSPAVLYFPKAHNPMLVEFPITKSEAEVSVLVARSGRSDSALSARVIWSSSNFSTSSTSPSGFPVTVTFGIGVRTQTIKIALSSLAPRTGCRFFTLRLQDVTTPSSPSAVSVEPDQSSTVYVDDMNGIGGGVTGRLISANYAADYSSVELTSNVTLDRVVASQVTLLPTTAAAAAGLLLQNQQMSILVAIDRNSASSIVRLLPALVAKLQTYYQLEPNGIQMGLLIGNTSSSVAAPPSAKFYPEFRNFFSAAEQLLNSSTSQQETLSWEWMTAGLMSNASGVWPATGRRFLWVFDSNQLSLSSSNPSSAALAFQSAARSQSAYTFFIQPPVSSPLSRGSNTIELTGISDLMQRVIYDTGVLILPSKILEAHQAKDASLPTRVDVLNDTYSLIASAQIQSFASGAGSLPVLKLVLNSIPTFSSYSSDPSPGILLGIPGLLRLRVRVDEPSHACFPPVISPPADPQLFSGWMDSWTLSSLAEVKRQWNALSSTLGMQLYEDSSLLRTATSTVLTLRDPQSTRLTMTRTLAGSDFSAGLALVLRGYMRSSNLSDGQWTRCQQKVAMITQNATVEAAITFNSSSSSISQGEWRYGWLERVVPWDLDNVEIMLDCNTSTPGVVIEWTTLGLLPDPEFACKCPRGFFNDALNAGNNTTTDGKCVRCPAGSYCPAGIKRRCPDGSFSFGKSSSCETCRDGWICIDGLARLCNPGTYASPSFTCEVCPAGFACRNGKRTSCPVGAFSLPQASDCQICPPGTISRLEAYILDVRALPTRPDVQLPARPLHPVLTRRANDTQWSAYMLVVSSDFLSISSDSGSLHRMTER